METYYIFEDEKGDLIYTLTSLWSSRKILDLFIETKKFKIVSSGRCKDEAELEEIIKKYK